MLVAAQQLAEQGAKANKMATMLVSHRAWLLQQAEEGQALGWGLYPHRHPWALPASDALHL